MIEFLLSHPELAAELAGGVLSLMLGVGALLRAIAGVVSEWRDSLRLRNEETSARIALTAGPSGTPVPTPTPEENPTDEHRDP